jgi:hypothetical protein
VSIARSVKRIIFPRPSGLMQSAGAAAPTMVA